MTRNFPVLFFVFILSPHFIEKGHSLNESRNVLLQDFLGKTYVDNPEAEEELKNIILAQTGKSVELKMVVAKEHNHTNLAKVTVDQALRENIHMDVVVEEDPDDAEE